MMAMLFATGRYWSAETVQEVAAQIRRDGAKAGVYLFEGKDGTALYVGRSLYKLAARVQEHADSRMYRFDTARCWAFESMCPGIDEVKLIAALLPKHNRETCVCPGTFPRPRVVSVMGTLANTGGGVKTATPHEVGWEA